jgi:hypothetical protein
VRKEEETELEMRNEQLGRKRKKEKVLKLLGDESFFL